MRAGPKVCHDSVSSPYDAARWDEYKNTDLLVVQQLGLCSVVYVYMLVAELYISLVVCISLSRMFESTHNKKVCLRVLVKDACLVAPVHTPIHPYIHTHIYPSIRLCADYVGFMANFSHNGILRWMS
jgi:hypothetical protein